MDESESERLRSFWLTILGFGSAVLEAASRVAAPGRVRVLGLPDRYVDHMTTRGEQLASAGLDVDGVERTVTSLLRPVPKA